MPKLSIRLLPKRFAVVRLNPGDEVPSWAWTEPLSAIVRTPAETSIMCEQEGVPKGIQSERDWVALMVEGPLPFSMTGILSSLVEPLASAQISVFAISSYDTDYILVKADKVQQAMEILRSKGHEIE